MQDEVDARYLAEFEREAQRVRPLAVSGHELDLVELSQSLGAVLEYILGDLFRQHEDARRYWVDGFIFESVERVSDRAVVGAAVAWCATHREQWQVPAQVRIEFSSLSDCRIASLRLHVGDAALGTLEEHRRRAPKSRIPDAWLLKFEVLLRAGE